MSQSEKFFAFYKSFNDIQTDRLQRLDDTLYSNFHLTLLVGMSAVLRFLQNIEFEVHKINSSSRGSGIVDVTSSLNAPVKFIELATRNGRKAEFRIYRVKHSITPNKQ